MKIRAIKTPVIREGDDLKPIIQGAIKTLAEKTVVVVTSKIISYSQGRLIDKKSGSRQEKHELVKEEADAYLPSAYSKYDMMLATKHHTLTVNAGIDESNAAGKYILWPENLQQEANEIWKFLRQVYQVEQLGVIVTDSRTWPLRWGVVGTCLVHSGFKQLADYRGHKDLFGRKIKMVRVNVAEAVAAAAVLEMGEVAEQTPLALVTGIKHIQFQDRVPTQQELNDLQIEVEDDVYGPFLTSVDWRKE